MSATDHAQADAPHFPSGLAVTIEPITMLRVRGLDIADGDHSFSNLCAWFGCTRRTKTKRRRELRPQRRRSASIGVEAWVKHRRLTQFFTREETVAVGKRCFARARSQVPPIHLRTRGHIPNSCGSVG